MSLRSHAMTEFRACGWCDENGKFEDDMQEMICKQVLEIVDLFASHGHSGSSANYALFLLMKLLAFEPIAPLTGEDWEWNEVGEGVLQNKRCSRVFKQTDRFDGQAYDIDARVFREPNGSCYTNGQSHRPIAFPYTPTTEYVDVPGEER